MTWLVPFVAIAGILVLALLLLRRRRRQTRRQRRQRRVLDELCDLAVESVHIMATSDRDLGEGQLIRGPKGLVRRGGDFLISPEKSASWPTPAGQIVRLHFEHNGVRHDLRCRLAGRARLSKAGRRRPGIRGATLFRLAPAGVIVQRERREIMRFALDEDAATDRMVDVRNFLGMDAWLWTVDADLDEGRTRLASQNVPIIAPHADPQPTPASGSAPPTLPEGETGGIHVSVRDFSGSGFLVEGRPEAVALLLPTKIANEEDLIEALGDLSLRIALRIHLTFPASVEDLEPTVPRWSWFLGDVARIWVETDEEDAAGTRIRLGLSLMYQTLTQDPITEWPARWSLIPSEGEADDLVALHSALNQAAARMDSVAPA